MFQLLNGECYYQLLFGQFYFPPSKKEAVVYFSLCTFAWNLQGADDSREDNAKSTNPFNQSDSSYEYMKREYEVVKDFFFF